MNSTYDLRWLGQTTMNWNIFGAAALLVGALLVKFGAPLPAVLLGVGCVGAWNWYRSRAGSPPTSGGRK